LELYAGKHVILDAITTSEKITEIKPIYDFIELASNELEMTLVYPPLVAYFPFAASELSRFIEKLEKEQIKSETLDFYKEVLNRRKTLDSGVSGVGV
jgi:S-adenosylmethionine decarboxylase